jgi:hypothetical protein
VTCPDCAALRAQRDRMLRIAQAARLFVEGGAVHFAELQRAVRDAIARADSRSVDERRREAEEMVERWARRVEELRDALHVKQETSR